jgi:hypothetical protein
MRQEFRLLKVIIRDYTPSEYSYEPEIGDRRAKQSDYDNVDVIPVSDPNAATMSQKVVQYQAVMQMAQANPDIYDMPELNRQMLEVLGVKNINKLIPGSEDQKPKDPVSENMAIINSKPVKAFMYQDHQAHIQVHMAFKDNPKIAQLVGQSPNAQTVMAAMEAHIAEHVAFEYRKQLEQQLGVPLPKPDEVLPEDIEYELSKVMAVAAQKLLAKDQSEAQQQQAEQQQQDPIIQMQQQELQIKQQDLEARSQKMMADAQLEQQKVQIEQERETSRVQLEQQKLELEKMRIESQERIAGAKLGADVVMSDKELQAKQLMEGTRLGIDAVKAKEQLANQKEQAAMQRETQTKQQETKKESTT